MTVAPPALVGGILSTDAYQLTMAQLYHRMGLHERPVRFEHLFRSYPDYGTHAAGYCIAAGLAPFVDWARSAAATDADVAALRSHRGRTGERLFTDDFCAWFATASFADLRIAAVPEGRVVHPNTPVVAVEGSLASAQLVETALLNQLGFATLVATKASRAVAAARGRPVVEFGMRRAQGRGADAASRAAVVGGALSTSHAAVAYQLGLTPSGTHAHSMVQAFIALGEGELGAFEAYADVYPDDCLLLVDTVNTLESGLPNAIRVFERLARAGHRPVGIRLDSGDLAHLAVQSSRELDAAGFADASIVISSQLDEMAIWQITEQIVAEARPTGQDPDHVIGRLVFGVGSRLATSHGAPSLDAVYKLVAIERDGGWTPTMKVSDAATKVLNPGRKRLWRVSDGAGIATADVMSTADEELTPGSDLVLHHHGRDDVSRTVAAAAWSTAEDLHLPVLDQQEIVYPGGGEALADLGEASRRREADLAATAPGVRRIINPHVHHVSITEELFRTKQELIARMT
ncbi:nicotinate phosphoribosyltransferase [Iamia sp. SCSIO 61187]|uniref:nicotinate phosphoribosyltransferase n=1 Tax=Iamia sp. SCSIO 61187 TaxID=2722752 RepID=UPI001C636790|nr:nicotinate phosphoribosyltransferase [Iamia sp. SCSIO 61187]